MYTWFVVDKPALHGATVCSIAPDEFFESGVTDRKQVVDGLVELLEVVDVG